MFWMALEDNPPGRRWYAKSLREWAMRASHVNRVHSALFGQRGRPATAVEKVGTVRLMLASVGIPFHVAREEDENDKQNPDRDRDITWEWDEDEWIGLDIRDACGVPLEKDANWVPPADADPYEDKDGDEDDEEYVRYDRDDCRHQ